MKSRALSPFSAATFSTVDINIYLAHQAISYVQTVLPLGSSNKASDEKKETYAETMGAIIRMRKALEKRDTETDSFAGHSIIERIKIYAQIYKDYGVGNCTEQTYVAFAFLYDLGLIDLDICAMPKSNHHFLVLGGNVVCDPWDERAYPVNQFKERQETSKDFKYATLAYRYTKTTPFLEGIPQSIFTSSSDGEPAIVNGEFVALSADEPQVGSGTCKTVRFILARYSFLSKLNNTKIKESPVYGAGSRELITQSDEINEKLGVVSQR